MDVLLAAHPGGLGREELASRTGVSWQSSAFDAALADLRALALVEYLPDRRVRASDGLFLE